MSKLQSLDAHEPPPPSFRALFKRFQKLSELEYATNSDIVDLNDPQRHAGLCLVDRISAPELSKTFTDFLGHSMPFECRDTPMYAVRAIPGLFVVPNLLPPLLQQTLISRLVHRDLSDPRHKTNLHLHYDLDYPSSIEDSTGTYFPTSFFTIPASSNKQFLPKDPSVHKPLTITQVLQKKLRWMTLGGQYDWTAKKYPQEESPPFPQDVQDLVQGLYPDIKCQAAIVNFYSPGDTLSLHRDVAEFCDNGLVSISFGCECLFMIGISPSESESLIEKSDSPPYAVIRLRSGDAVYMSEEARAAWHGVPRVSKNSCPVYLQDWPAGQDDSDNFDSWRGWMKGKRINLNIRQMQR